MKTFVAAALGAVLLAGCHEGAGAPHGDAHIEPNAETSFTPRVTAPSLHKHDFVHPLAAVIGAVELGDDVFVAPGASIRGDEGQPIHVGTGSNVQDGVVIHALETFDNGHVIEENLVRVGGLRYAALRPSATGPSSACRRSCSARTSATTACSSRARS